MPVCKTEDDFVKYELKWVAHLSNGETVYQDDNRPGEAEPKAWIRLKNYLYENYLNIKSLDLQFCDNIVKVLPDEAEGFYYAQGIMGSPGLYEDQYIKFYTIGYVDKETKQVNVNRWIVPAIIDMNSGEQPRKIDVDDPSLIINPQYLEKYQSL